MIAHFYTNCALVTRNIEVEAPLLSENSMLTQLESRVPFSVVCPSLLTVGATVLYGEEGQTGTVLSTSDKYSDVSFSLGESGTFVTRLTNTQLTVQSLCARTLIRANGEVTERVNELVWSGKGYLDVDQGTLRFHARLMNATPHTLELAEVHVHDGNYDQESYESSRSVPSTRFDLVKSASAEKIEKSSVQLPGSHTLTSLKDVKIMEQEINIVRSLHYDLLGEGNYFGIDCLYEGEIYRGNYTVKYDSYGIIQNCHIRPSKEKKIELKLRNDHPFYTIDVEIMERNEFGFMYKGKITSQHNSSFPLNVFVVKQTDFVYYPGVIDTGKTVAWVVNIAPGETKEFVFRALRVQERRKMTSPDMEMSAAAVQAVQE
jgi:hypothetical protein